MRKFTVKHVWLTLAMLLIFSLAVACGPATPAPPDETDSDDTAVTTTEIPADLGDIDFGEMPQIEYIETEAGTGDQPVPGDRVAVHYTGTLADGTVFDSSLERGQPIEFVLGQGMVIPGWEQGIAMMSEGGKATLVIPPDLAYGPQGSPPTIPPDATLTFEVELVEVFAAPKPLVLSEGDYTETESGLKYFDIVDGTGDIPIDSDRVLMEFAAWLEDGTFLGSSQQMGSPLVANMGTGQLFPGWEEGLLTMQEGGTRQLMIPPALGYGEEGAGSLIPPNATLIWQITLVDVIEARVPQDVAEDDYTVTDSGLKYFDLTDGSGDVPEANEVVVVHYTGWLEDGTEFDSSLDTDDPLVFQYGTPEMIAGFTEGLATMRVGGQRQLVIPAELGYGMEGAGGIIPPGATLIFEIELVEIMEQ
ncbi:MAG: FKBP-type peptidyl-prolyl cis-trans isomerase [Chloroflexota bacterium]